MGMASRPSTIRKKTGKPLTRKYLHLCRDLALIVRRLEALAIEIEDAESVRVAFDQGKTVERPKRKKR